MPKKSSERSMKSRTKNSDVIQIPVPKGQREVIKAFAAEHGMSMNEFIRAAIRYQMKNFSLSLSEK